MFESEWCPDGLCQARVNLSDAQAVHDGIPICGGKITRVLVREGPIQESGTHTTWEELLCIRCAWSKKIQVIDKKFIKFKGELESKKKRRKKHND